MVRVRGPGFDWSPLAQESAFSAQARARVPAGKARKLPPRRDLGDREHRLSERPSECEALPVLILPPSFVIELEHPWFGAFVLAASTAAFVRVLLSSGFRARHVPRAILALVVVALATGPSVRDPDPPRTRIFVVDRSRSFARARASIQAALEGGTRDLDPARD